MFESPTTDAGEVRIGEKKIMTFDYTGDIQRIVSVVGCNCVSVKHNKSKKNIELTYTPVRIPKHLRVQGYYRPKKSYSITVDLEDGTRETHTITFTATVRQ
jgi:hypothetical protein